MIERKNYVVLKTQYYPYYEVVECSYNEMRNGDDYLGDIVVSFKLPLKVVAVIDAHVKSIEQQATAEMIAEVSAEVESDPE